MITISKVQACQALVRSGIYRVDFCLNPYIGCEHNCLYCYATFMGRWFHPSEDWGNFVDVKVNLPKILKKEIKLASGKVLLGSVTDPYQPLELKFQITRKCLLAFLENYRQSLFKDFSNWQISILTKSNLILRDLDLLGEIPNLEVGLTITSLEPQIASFFEPKAPAPSLRLEVLEELKKKGISTYAFFGPILPYFSDKPDSLFKIIKRIKEAGVSYIFVDKLNHIYGKTKARLFPIYKREGEDAEKIFRYAQSEKYVKELRKNLQDVLAKIKIKAKILF